jgi:citrate lyase beta subunit
MTRVRPSSPRRSVVEVPANVQKMVDKAERIATDVVMLDLEDCVPRQDAAKTTARELAGTFISRGQHLASELAVRINSPDSDWFFDDLAWVVRQKPVTVVVPKVRSWREYLFVEDFLIRGGRPGTPVILIVETPGALLDLERIAAESVLLTGLIAGGYDYTLECRATALSALGGLGSSFSQDHLEFMRQKVVAVAAAYGLDALDGPIVPDPKDAAQIRTAAQRARDQGFTGCSVMYPPVAVVCNEVFTPTDGELGWARQVLAAYAEAEAGGRAAFALNGATILPQHKTLALRILDQNRASAVASGFRDGATSIRGNK